MIFLLCFHLAISCSDFVHRRFKLLVRSNFFDVSGASPRPFAQLLELSTFKIHEVDI